VVTTLARAAVIVLAVAAALVPLPPWAVEALYSTRTYLAIQTAVTPLTNRVPFALLDVACLLLLAVGTARFLRGLRQRGFLRTVAGGLLPLATLASVVYLIFLAMWGLNYRRMPIEEKLGFDDDRVTREAVRKLGEQAVATLNATYDAAHAPARDGVSLEAAFAAAQQRLGAPRLAATGVPKWSLLGFYFRVAAIDGMTNPFFLEITINPDTLPFERPFVLAHEWGHLAGYADEAEASLVAWLTCMQGDALARYSGWFAVYEHVSVSLPRTERAALAALLAPGPRRDVDASVARYARSSPVVRTAARDVYDSYLRANRVDEGIASYMGIVRLIIGAGLAAGS
jgi:hypothetical protein